jgi:hypothetical protein
MWITVLILKKTAALGQLDCTYAVKVVSAWT